MRLISSLALLAIAPMAMAQTYKEWQDPNINQVNRLPMVAPFEQGQRLSLNGTWRFQWKSEFQSAADFDRQFFLPSYNDQQWAEMPVPGMWELNGFGDPIYVNVGYAWRNQYRHNPPYVPTENNHVGYYRREIEIPADWKGQQLIAHFGSVTSCMYLWINGKFVGYSEDSKLEPEFDVTSYLKPGQKNVIAMQVLRWCDGTYLEDQDFFRYCGIARDSWLMARNKSHIEDIHANATLDDSYQQGLLSVDVKTTGGKASLELLDAEGNTVAKGAAGQPLTVDQVNAWSAETPYLYTLRVALSQGAKVVDETSIKVGFRRIELKNAQVLVNGQPILIKGADRHELDPDGGYVVSRERMIEDIKIMKEFNINAVRTCHYPDDNLWYDLCDEYGIYMVAEANVESHGMGYGESTLAKNAAYHKAHQERNERNVERNRNHPAVIFWSLGNEAGYGPNFEDAYDLVKRLDPTRPVQYEQARVSGKTDIYCPMYADYNWSERYSREEGNGNEKYDKPLIQCEYAHAMGNSEGGFREYWDLIRKYPKYQGGFIWDFVDQSIRWPMDKLGSVHAAKNHASIADPSKAWVYGYGGDFNRYDGSDGNFCDNGLISPDRVPNPHMYEVGYYYQSIWSSLDGNSLKIHNENFFRDLSAYRLEWNLVRDGEVQQIGYVEDLKVAPQADAHVTLPALDTKESGEYFLNVYYRLKQREGLLAAGYIVAKQQFPLTVVAAPALAEAEAAAPAVLDNDANYVIVRGADYQLDFDRHNGFLTRYVVNHTEYIKEGEAVRPNFWRAPTDNDFGAGLQRRLGAWKHPRLDLKELKAEGLTVTARYEMSDLNKAALVLTYTIGAGGKLTVRQQMTPGEGDAKISDLPRFGLALPMPADFEQLSYYGRGPVETYSDRKDSEFIGCYESTVTDQFYSYIRPQENGNHVDLRWMRLASRRAALRIESVAQPFSGSALHYTVASLDEGPDKHQMHSQEVAPQPVTNVLLDLKQMGLGCVNSWGAWPREEYRLPFQTYDFSVTLIPER